MAYVSGPPRRRNFGQVRATSYTVEYTVFQRCLPSMAKPPGSCSLLTQEFAANGRRRHYCFESRRILRYRDTEKTKTKKGKNPRQSLPPAILTLLLSSLCLCASVVQ